MGQVPAQAAVSAMQTPLQRTFGTGQVPPHEVPSQVAVPPWGTAQAVQALPQLCGSAFPAQLPPHVC